MKKIFLKFIIKQRVFKIMKGTSPLIHTHSIRREQKKKKGDQILPNENNPQKWIYETNLDGLRVSINIPFTNRKFLQIACIS